MTCAPGDNECLLRTYLTLVAEQRDVRLDRAVELRQDDVAVLAELLDLHDTELEARLVRLLRLSERDAADLRHQLLRHKVAAATLGVGMLAAIPVGVAAADTEAAPEPTSTTVVVEPSTTATTAPPTTVTVVVTAPPTTAAAPPATVAPAAEPETEVGYTVRYERDPDFVPPPGVEIGDAMVIERDPPAGG